MKSEEEDDEIWDTDECIIMSQNLTTIANSQVKRSVTPNPLANANKMKTQVL